MQKYLLKKITKLHNDDEHEKVLALLLAIPEKEREWEGTSLLARAYNNLDGFEKAEELLLSVENEGKDDFSWNFRLGYARYYLDKMNDAKVSFEKALELDPAFYCDKFKDMEENQYYHLFFTMFDITVFFIRR